MSATKSSKPVALVTGAAGIIGPFLCESLVADGWAVAAAGRSLESFERFERLNGRSHPADQRFAADLRSPEACRNLVSECEDALGPIQLIVNNATGNSQPPQDFESMTADYCAKVFQVDVQAGIFLAQAAYASLRKNGGQIINISSVRRRSFAPGYFVYAAAKGAVDALTEALAYEFFDGGIRVNALRVGSVPGDSFLRPALEQVDAATAVRIKKDVEAKFRRELREQGEPCAAPSEIGVVVAFLSSKRASFINGAVLDVDGGFPFQIMRKALRNETTSDEPGIHDFWKYKPEEALKTWLSQNS
jgi:NAD(P)-dependent dehydrogenase (short-subunit alcohol dehydrogenase family)